MLFPSSLFTSKVIILTSQGHADFHTMWTNVSIHTTSSGCMVSCFYWFFLIISLSWKIHSSIASLNTEWFWTAYSVPALCGSSRPFLSSRVLISYLALDTCHGVWGDVKGLHIQMSGRRAGIETWGGPRGQSRVICTPFLWYNHLRKPLITFLGHSSIVSAILCLRTNMFMKQLYSYCVVCKVLPYLSAVPHCRFIAWWNRATYVLFLERKWILKERV